MSTASAPVGGTTASRLCREAEITAPWYRELAALAGDRPMANRKQWEHLATAQALRDLGCLAPGKRGLGFGVGREPLPALFAGMGAEIIATDLPSGAGASGWSASGQHCDAPEDLHRPTACTLADFRRLVTYRPLDMTRIPEELHDAFDFTWSSCALEHLGSLEAGLRFIIDQARCLKPGGWAVHTTEFNVLSPRDTWMTGGTVAYRASDLQALATACRRAGLELTHLDLDPGNRPLDWAIDLWPYRPEPHLKLLSEGRFVLTSALLVVQRPASCAAIRDPGQIVPAAGTPGPAGPDGWELVHAPAPETRAAAEAEAWRLRYLAASGSGEQGADRVLALEAECRRWRDAYQRLAAHPLIKPLLWLRRRLRGVHEPTSR